MALTQKQRDLRDGKLTASQVGVLMGADQAKILNLWRFHIGDPAYVEDDLSGVWPVRLGEATEAIHLEWYGRKQGHHVSRKGEVVDGPQTWMAATLDGWDTQRGIPVEVKHVGGREPLETIIARYTPQCTWQMLCTGTKQCALSVIMGANEPVVEFLTLDEDYAAELMRRATNFMWHVENLSPPVALPAVAAPVAAAKIYQFGDNPKWVAQADRWLQAYGANQISKEAEKELKALVPPDALRVYGGGIVVSKNRAGAVRLRKEVPA